MLLGASIRNVDAQITSAALCRSPQHENLRSTAQNGWYAVETENFSVWNQESMHLAVTTACECEELRPSLRHAWGFPDQAPSWQPKCVIVLHRSAADFQRDVGGEAGTVGCTTITSNADRVVFRRIDLRIEDPNWRGNVLCHELTHVVLADRFCGQQLPQWLSEGLAMLSESEQLRERRSDVLEDAFRRRRVPRLDRLVSDKNDVSCSDPDVVYAASLSLIAYLESLGGRQKLLDFADRLLLSDCDLALRQTYGMTGGRHEWEQRWLANSTPKVQVRSRP